MEEPQREGRRVEELGLEPASVWLVIPAYNEDQALSGVIEIPEALGYSIVVVDDGSHRPVRELLRGHRVHICRHLVNLGQGAALQTGIRYALSQGAVFIVTFDADGQHDYRDIPSLLAPLARGEAEAALGSRFLAGGAAENIPELKRLILKLATAFTRVTTGLAVTDTHNGFRAFTASAASRIRITQNGMAHATQFLLEVKEAKIPYVEVPVHIRYTEYSMSKGQRISNLFNILWESMMERFRL